MTTKIPVVAIVGQTASGKSALAVELARKFSGSIISADSRQVYRGLDIGSGKITKREQQGVPHALLDIAHPRRVFSVAQFVRAGHRAINAAAQHGRLPIVVGGTGFWVDALLRGLTIPNVPPDARFRKSTEALTTAALFARLRRLDPRRAATIDAHNRVRLIRALEIIRATKKPVPTKTADAPYAVLWLGVRLPPKQLRKNIHVRLQKRIRHGLVAEVRHLLAHGVPKKRLLDLGLEYRFTARFLAGECTRQQYAEDLERAIWHFAKRQMTWFKRHRDITWIRTPAEANRAVRAFGIKTKT